jgi:hypothetical protein
LPLRILEIAGLDLSEGHRVPDRDACTTLCETANDHISQESIRKRP